MGDLDILPRENWHLLRGRRRKSQHHKGREEWLECNPIAVRKSIIGMHLTVKTKIQPKLMGLVKKERKKKNSCKKVFLCGLGRKVHREAAGFYQGRI